MKRNQTNFYTKCILIYECLVEEGVFFQISKFHSVSTTISRFFYVSAPSKHFFAFITSESNFTRENI